MTRIGPFQFAYRPTLEANLSSSYTEDELYPFSCEPSGVAHVSLRLPIGGLWPSELHTPFHHAELEALHHVPSTSNFDPLNVAKYGSANTEPDVQFAGWFRRRWDWKHLLGVKALLRSGVVMFYTEETGLACIPQSL
mgnify:CR=1 FL=1